MSQPRHHPKIQSLYGHNKASTIQYCMRNEINIARRNIILKVRFSAHVARKNIYKKIKNNLLGAKIWRLPPVCLHRIYDQTIQKRDFCTLLLICWPAVM